MTNTSVHTVFIALGSNLGDRLDVLRRACMALALFMQITARSRIYETPPAYVTDQPAFLNAAIGGVTNLSPIELLHALKAAERSLGRTPTFQYGPRVIDLDIILYDHLRLQTPELTIPHAHFSQRAFVLRPLADIASDVVDPVSGKRISDLLSAVPDADSAVAIEDQL